MNGLIAWMGTRTAWPRTTLYVTAVCVAAVATSIAEACW